MNRRDFELELMDLLEGEETPDREDRVRRFLDAHPEERALYESSTRLLTEIRPWLRTAEPSPQTDQMILRAARTRQPLLARDPLALTASSPSLSWWRRLFSRPILQPLAGLATVLCVAGLSYVLYQQTSPLSSGKQATYDLHGASHAPAPSATASEARPKPAITPASPLTDATPSPQPAPSVASTEEKPKKDLLKNSDSRGSLNAQTRTTNGEDPEDVSSSSRGPRPTKPAVVLPPSPVPLASAPASPPPVESESPVASAKKSSLRQGFPSPPGRIVSSEEKEGDISGKTPPPARQTPRRSFGVRRKAKARKTTRAYRRALSLRSRFGKRSKAQDPVQHSKDAVKSNREPRFASPPPTERLVEGTGGLAKQGKYIPRKGYAGRPDVPTTPTQAERLPLQQSGFNYPGKKDPIPPSSLSEPSEGRAENSTVQSSLPSPPPSPPTAPLPSNVPSATSDGKSPKASPEERKRENETERVGSSGWTPPPPPSPSDAPSPSKAPDLLERKNNVRSLQRSGGNEAREKKQGRKDELRPSELQPQAAQDLAKAPLLPKQPPSKARRGSSYFGGSVARPTVSPPSNVPAPGEGEPTTNSFPRYRNYKRNPTAEIVTAKKKLSQKEDLRQNLSPPSVRAFEAVSTHLQNQDFFRADSAAIAALRISPPSERPILLQAFRSLYSQARQSERFYPIERLFQASP